MSLESVTQLSPSEYTTSALRIIQKAQSVGNGLARVFSLKYDIPLDDLRQEIALVVLKGIKKQGSLPNADAYLYTVVRNHFLNLAKKARRNTIREGLSLDMPCGSDDGASTYGELLIDDGPTLDEKMLHNAVQRAIRTLPPDEESYISEHYTGHLDTLSELHRTQDVTRRAAFRHLRKALRSELQEPVCDIVGCQHNATAFDSDQLLFVCSEHSQCSERSLQEETRQ